MRVCSRATWPVQATAAGYLKCAQNMSKPHSTQGSTITTIQNSNCTGIGASDWLC